MKKQKDKSEKNTNKYGVFNGNVIKSDTIVADTEFIIEPYKDESITITQISGDSYKRQKTLETPPKIKKSQRII
ncbi:hypothetical protein SCLARK_00474 [Spiroplasma clarkii]|uniref:hypothetical protein n=1 Tax=Spiroplasma clarkii TaxID=2139 RepID=UPI000B5726B2|nr:hypothetical protein [Spiroplasma clarkii]ARU91186.1 hypothetical protein SCLARK_00474 [Spiroplasma clarkii]